MSERWNGIVNVAILVTLAALLLNPWGVVGRSISSAYGGWRERSRVERTWDKLVGAPSVLGLRPLDGRGVIVEFVAYDCPACQTVAPAVSDAVRAQEVSIVVRHVPSEGSGPAATEAALAAICAERYGSFPEAHDALISNPTWLETRDWMGLVVSLGIGNPESFGECIGAETTKNRLARDRALADYLRIPGTPTFVSGGRLHPGTQGLVSALAAVSGTVAGDGVPTRVLAESIFDSSKHSDLSEMPEIVGGLFLPDSGIALIERSRIHIVDLSSGDARVVGRKGEGPREFGHIWTTNHTPQGILVWDVLRHRAVFVGHDGEFVSSRGYIDTSFQSYFDVRPVGVAPDGRIVFRDGPGSYGEFGRGRLWDPAWYVAVQEDGELQPIAKAKGEEMYYGQRRSGAVILGHRTFEAATEDRLIIADTDRGAIAVLDWSGKEVAEIPMPAGARLSAAQVQAGRQSRASEIEQFVERVRASAVAEGPTGPPSLDGFDGQSYLKNDWPANDIAPPIDTLLTDFDSRLWVRDYRLPEQDSVTWRAWDIDRAQPLFTVKLDGDDILFDARGDLILLRRVNALDVARAEVRRLTEVPE